MTDPREVILDAVHGVLVELDVVAHNPIQGEALHKVVTGHVLERLDAHGYAVTRKEAADE